MNYDLTEETIEEGRVALFQLERQLQERKSNNADNNSESSSRQSSHSSRRMLDQVPRVARLNQRLESLGLTVEQLDDRGLLDGGGTVPNFYASMKQKGRRPLELQSRSDRLQERGKEATTKLLDGLFHMTRLLVSRGWDLYDQCKQHDTDGRGLMPKLAFTAIFKSIGLPFSTRDLVEITRNYAVPSSDKVDYVSMLKDAGVDDSVGDGPGQPTVLIDLKRMLLDSVRSLSKHQDDVYRMFARWDTKGTGTVTATQFIRVLERLHVRLSDQNQDFLVELLDINAMGRIDFDSLLSFCFAESTDIMSPNGMVITSHYGDDNWDETVSAVSTDKNSVDLKSNISGNNVTRQRNRPHTATLSRPYNEKDTHGAEHYASSGITPHKASGGGGGGGMNSNGRHYYAGSGNGEKSPGAGQYNKYFAKTGSGERPQTASSVRPVGSSSSGANDSGTPKSGGGRRDAWETTRNSNASSDKHHNRSAYDQTDADIENDDGGVDINIDDLPDTLEAIGEADPKKVDIRSSAHLSRPHVDDGMTDTSHFSSNVNSKQQKGSNNNNNNNDRHSTIYVDAGDVGDTGGSSILHLQKPQYLEQQEQQHHQQQWRQEEEPEESVEPKDHLILLANQILGTLREIILKRYRYGSSLQQIYRHFDRAGKHYFDATDFVQATADLSIEVSEKVAHIAIRQLAIDGYNQVCFGEFKVFVLDSDHKLLEIHVQQQLAHLLEQQGRDYQSWMVDTFWQQQEDELNDSSVHNESKVLQDRRNGLVSKTSFVHSLQAIGAVLTPAEVGRLVVRFDVQGDGMCSVTRFARMVQTSSAWKEAERVLHFQDEAIEEAEYLRTSRRNGVKYSKSGVALPNIPEELISMCEYLGIRVLSEQNMLWIASDALKAPLPVSWTAQKDASGRTYFYNSLNNQSKWEHPLDPHFRKLRDKYRQGGDSTSPDVNPPVRSNMQSRTTGAGADGGGGGAGDASHYAALNAQPPPRVGDFVHVPHSLRPSSATSSSGYNSQIVNTSNAGQGGGGGGSSGDGYGSIIARGYGGRESSGEQDTRNRPRSALQQQQQQQAREHYPPPSSARPIAQSQNAAKDLKNLYSTLASVGGTGNIGGNSGAGGAGGGGVATGASSSASSFRARPVSAPMGNHESQQNPQQPNIQLPPPDMMTMGQPPNPTTAAPPSRRLFQQDTTAKFNLSATRAKNEAIYGASYLQSPAQQFSANNTTGPNRGNLAGNSGGSGMLNSRIRPVSGTGRRSQQQQGTVVDRAVNYGRPSSAINGGSSGGGGGGGSSRPFMANSSFGDSDAIAAERDRNMKLSQMFEGDILQKLDHAIGAGNSKR